MPLVPLLEHKNADFVLGKSDRRAGKQRGPTQSNIGKRGSSIGKKKESCEPPKLSIGKSKCAQICLFLKLVR